MYSDNTVSVIDDFKSLNIFDRKVRKIRYNSQDKGHINCINEFSKSIKEGTKCPISFEEIYMSSLVTILVNKSLSENRKIEL